MSDVCLFVCDGGPTVFCQALFNGSWLLCVCYGVLVLVICYFRQSTPTPLLVIFHTLGTYPGMYPIALWYTGGGTGTLLPVLKTQLVEHIWHIGVRNVRTKYKSKQKGKGRVEDWRSPYPKAVSSGQTVRSSDASYPK